MGRKRETKAEADGLIPMGNVEVPIPASEEECISEFFV